MAKRGSSKHLKRIAIPKEIPLEGKKHNTWLVRGLPGAHPFSMSMPLAVLLRDVLKIAKTLKEAETILSQRLVLVDGKPRTEPKFPVGFMDIIDIPQAGKTYRIIVNSHGYLLPREISNKQKNVKLARVEKKFVVPGSKIAITLHDGKTLQVDKQLKIGDTVQVTLPKPSIQGVLPLKPGARCLVREGKHAGTLATLEEIIQRREGHANEARLKHGDQEFITVAKYLFVVDEKFSL